MKNGILNFLDDKVRRRHSLLFKGQSCCPLKFTVCIFCQHFQLVFTNIPCPSRLCKLLYENKQTMLWNGILIIICSSPYPYSKLIKLTTRDLSIEMESWSSCPMCVWLERVLDRVRHPEHQKKIRRKFQNGFLHPDPNCRYYNCR